MIDPLLAERVVWSGKPHALKTPKSLKVVAWAWITLALTSTCFAVVVSLALATPPGTLLLFAAWCATCALLCLTLPKAWQEKTRYLVTERHVVCERGPFRRTIERKSITFARIIWSERAIGTGDIELVRAVPTGALRRRLLLRLEGVIAPDRVWDIIRGVSALASPSQGGGALSQRLDPDERVIWSARPHARRFTYFPQGKRGWVGFGLALGLFWIAADIVSRMLPILAELRSAGLAEVEAAYVALIAAELVTVTAVCAASVYLLYSSLVLPSRNLGSTSYLITNTRVLIQRGNEELYLDRAKVVDVVDMPALKGASDVFLVLDGPWARALAMNGAFGEMERGLQLRPVLESIDDVEGITRALVTSSRDVAARFTSLPPAA